LVMISLSKNWMAVCKMLIISKKPFFLGIALSREDLYTLGITRC
jgi:hypothetical protein